MRNLDAVTVLCCSLFVKVASSAPRPLTRPLTKPLVVHTSDSSSINAMNVTSLTKSLGLLHDPFIIHDDTYDPVAAIKLYNYTYPLYHASAVLGIAIYDAKIIHGKSDNPIGVPHIAYSLHGVDLNIFPKEGLTWKYWHMFAQIIETMYDYHHMGLHFNMTLGEGVGYVGRGELQARAGIALQSQ